LVTGAAARIFPGANQVGSGAIAAIDTAERLLHLAIGLVDRPACRTSSAGGAWVDGSNRHAFKRPLGTHELAKSSKGPPVQTVAWRPSGLNRLADKAPRFDCHDVAGRQGKESLPDTFDVGAITQALTGRGAGRNREVEFVAGMPPHTPTRS
jgi:hypothetical protein